MHMYECILICIYVVYMKYMYMSVQIYNLFIYLSMYIYVLLLNSSTFLLLLYWCPCFR